VDEKRLSGFTESRAERFAREKLLLKSLSKLDYDSRKEFPVLVSRESTIRHETNSYSVPPQHIGQMLLLKIHPFTAEAEVFSPEGSIRRFLLEPCGSRSKKLFSEDLEALRIRWDADRARLARVRRPRARVPQKTVDVEVRSPSVYEALFIAEQAAAL
jgi:hypothetical protein